MCYAHFPLKDRETWLQLAQLANQLVWKSPMNSVEIFTISRKWYFTEVIGENTQEAI